MRAWLRLGIMALALCATVAIAQAEGPYDDGVKAYNARDFQNAAIWFHQAADQGHPQAQMLLGIMNYFGQGMPQDFGAAADWYRKAAEQGEARAQTNLGVMYYAGRGVAQDYQAAAKWYREAADQGDTSAQVNLARLYEKGQGVPQDYVILCDCTWVVPHGGGTGISRS
jgi:uncharacterized protein